MPTKKLQIKKRVVCKCKGDEQPVFLKNNRDVKKAPETIPTLPTGVF